MTEDFDSDPPGVLERSIGQPVAGPWLARRIVLTIVVIVALVSLAVAVRR